MVDIPYQNVIDYFNNFSCYRNVIVKNSSAKGTGSYIDESMVSFVSKRYMRVVKGSLVVCLSEYESPWLILKIMSFRPTCYP